MKRIDYRIYNAKGVLVRTTDDLKLARRYVEDMARLGSIFRIVREVVKQRAAA